MEYYSAMNKKKEGNLAIWDDMDGAGEDPAEISKSVGDIPTPRDLTHMWDVRNKTNEQRDKEKERKRETDS